MTDVREQLYRLMRSTLADNANWTYKAVRPMPVPPAWRHGQKVTADCSKGVQFLCKWANAPDPMGNDFGVWGNSTTMAVHLPHLPNPGQLKVGDIVTFGPGGTQHATMVLELGFDPLLWSHGHQGAPNTYRLSRDRRQAQFLRLPVPVSHVITPEALRARTGYWAWLAWKQGEGDWKPYGAENRNVRPDVPRRIPAKWWLDRERFLRNRKKPNKAKPPARKAGS